MMDEETAREVALEVTIFFAEVKLESLEQSLVEYQKSFDRNPTHYNLGVCYEYRVMISDQLKHIDNLKTLRYIPTIKGEFYAR